MWTVASREIAECDFQSWFSDLTEQGRREYWERQAAERERDRLFEWPTEDWVCEIGEVSGSYS